MVEFMSYDSAGVQIAENVNVGWEEAPRWTSSEERVLGIGTLYEEEAAQFHQSMERWYRRRKSGVG